MEKQQMDDAAIQSLGLEFSFVQEPEKLVIQALSTSDHIVYEGQIASHPLIDFVLIQQMIQEGEFKTLIKTQKLLKIRIGATIVDLNAKQNSQVTQLKQTIKQLLETQNYLNTIIETQKKTIEKYHEQNQKLQRQLKQLKQNQQQKQLQNQKQKVQKIQKIQKTQKAKNEQSQKIIDLSNQFRQEKAKQLFKWNQKCTHPNLMINGNMVSQSNKSDNAQFSLLDVQLNQSKTSISTWKIKIKKNPGLIYVGIWDKTIAQSKELTSQNIRFTKTNHGFYMIRSDGYCFSNSMKEYNDVKRSFSFNEEDIIWVEYEPEEKIVTFRLNRNERRLVMPISQKDITKKLSPCVGLHYNPIINFFFSEKLPAVQLIDSDKFIMIKNKSLESK